MVVRYDAPTFLHGVVVRAKMSSHLVAAMLTTLTRLLCRHEDMIHFEPGRVYLRCERCGRVAAGWTLDLPGPRRVADEQRVARSRIGSVAPLWAREG